MSAAKIAIIVPKAAQSARQRCANDCVRNFNNRLTVRSALRKTPATRTATHYHLIMCLYCSLTETRLMVSYPRMILKENAADCTNRAVSPLKNMWKCSSCHSSRNATLIESSRCTCSRARTMSSGLVMMVVVNPPKLPATHCTNRCDTHGGTIFSSSSWYRW
uniref:Uncharacterized protein n=1 Tax=Anopheles atroparvus TaxID=41427 RepID=A0A182JDW3_ANOAO